MNRSALALIFLFGPQLVFGSTGDSTPPSGKVPIIYGKANTISLWKLWRQRKR